MGYFIKKIAKDNEELMPAEVSLAGNPNYVQFESYRKTGKALQSQILRWKEESDCFNEWLVEREYGASTTYKFVNLTGFAIRDKKTGDEYRFKARFSDDAVAELINFEFLLVEDTDADFVGFNTFGMDFGADEMLDNLRKSMLDIDFFNENFNISLIDPETESNIKDMEFISKDPLQPHELEIIPIGSDYLEIEARMTDYDKLKVDISLQVADPTVIPSKTVISIAEKEDSKEHRFEGTTNEKEVNNTTFFLSQDPAITAENIRACLMKDTFFRSNFDISISPVRSASGILPGDTIRIVSRGEGARYAFDFKDALDKDFIKLLGDFPEAVDNDSISAGKGNCEIELDIYRDTGLFIGEKDFTTLGTYVTTLSKSYFNKPLWFEVNAIASDRAGYSPAFLDAGGWCDAGTVSDCRFVAKRFDGVNREVFFISDVLYTLNGYNRSVAQNGMAAYVYNPHESSIVKPLTNQPRLTHISGQTHYFNFILSDPERKAAGGENPRIGLFYRLYTQSGNFIAEKMMHVQDKSLFTMVNTIALDIDGAMEGHDNVGHVQVSLCRNGITVSEPLEFDILPAHLYRVNDFAFLNSLGGWSSFSFGGTMQTEFKTKTNTIYHTRTPEHGRNDGIESVFNKEVEEQFTVETMPVSASVADWLKEVSASVAVYELATKRYVVVDELNVKHNTKDDLFTLQMKYHYSDSYSGTGR